MGREDDDRIRVLVADDDPVTRLLVGEALEREGFAVTVAEGGEAALVLFAECPFDLILLDVLMPGLDGFTTCARLRQMPAGPHVPIVMITGLDDESSIQHAYGAGATDFITKPINPLIFAHRVRYILRASAAMRELAWRVDFQRVLIETIPVPIAVEDAQGHHLVCNPAFDALTGEPHAGMAGTISREPGHEIPKPAVPVAGDASPEPWRQRVYEAEMLGAGDEPKSVIVRQAAFTSPVTGEAGVISVVLDITERKRTEENLRLAETVFQTAADAIMVTDAMGVIKSVNPAFTTITGYSPDEAIGLTARLLKAERQNGLFYLAFWKSLCETGRWSGELWQRRKNGEIYPIWETVAAVRSPDGRILEYVAFFNDVTARKRAEQEIFYRANYDLLTGLPNRSLLHERLEQALKQARRYDRQVVLMFVDLDRFKQVNDTLGHGFGDRLLYQAAARLEACVRDADTVARQGGDEFVVVLPNVVEERDASVVAEKIIARLAEPFDLGGNIVHIGASIGVALYPGHGDNTEELVRHADLAMYQAKIAGRSTYRVYEPAMTDELTRQLLLERDLRMALERGRIGAALPADPGSRQQPVGWRRGVAALVPSAARRGAAERVRPTGRGNGFDSRNRCLGARSSVPDPRTLARDRSGHLACGQLVECPNSSWLVGGNAGGFTRTLSPHAAGPRLRDDGRDLAGRWPTNSTMARRCPATGHPSGSRRFRYGLFLAVLFETVPDRSGQDRSFVHARHGGGPQR
jgi:diguanylate cyclase (GGDEF)-like protein/PAS domain S-box-containing protein